MHSGKRMKQKSKRYNIIYIVPLLIILVVVLIYYFFYVKVDSKVDSNETNLEFDQNSQTESEEIDVSKYPKLNSDLLEINNLKNELNQNVNNLIKDMKLTQINYQLKKLDEGKTILEYTPLQEKEDIIRVKIDINSKTIEKIERIKSDTIDYNVLEIQDNLNENIKEDFELKKEELDVQSNSYINILVKENEININLAVENL